MAGHAMVGAGFEANPGKFRLGYMRGRLLKAVQPNTIIEDSEYFAIPSFERTGQVFKLGYGNPNNFVDLIMLKASDDIQSLDSIPDTYGLQPAENAIVSIVIGQQINDKLNVGIEYAQSSYTNDTRSEGTSEDKGLFSIFSFLTDSKNSTEVSSALEAFVDLKLDWFGTRLKLERISPNYRSMGAYFFLSDVQKITVEPRVNIWNNRLSITTSLGFQKNNLSKQKSQQTNRSIGSVRINARVTSFYSISGHFSNYGISQKEGLVPVSEDNYISQVTNNWGINQNFQFTGTSFMHNAILNFQRQQLTDDNPNTSLFTNYHNRTLFIIYNFNYLPKQIGANISYTHTKFTNQSLENTYSGPNIGVNISLLRKALRISLSQSFLTNVANGASQRRVDKLSLRASYKLNRQQKISLRTYFNKSNSFIETIDPFEETKIDLQYVYQFR